MCRRCDGLTATLGWSALVQVGYPDGTIMATPDADRIVNRAFYLTGNDWPVCPDCGERLPADAPQPQPAILPPVSWRGIIYALLGAAAWAYLAVWVLT